jgi:probable HAF family extracellular repeat protein
MRRARVRPLVLPLALPLIAPAACTDPTSTDVAPPLRSSVQPTWVRVFTLRDLGGLPVSSTDNEAMAINNSGQVVGTSRSASSVWHGFSWTPAAGMVDIGSLGGQGGSIFPYDVNDAGQVVGDGLAIGASGFAEEHAFLWTAATGVQDLHPASSIGDRALGINNQGQIAGAVSFDAFIWTTAGGTTNIGRLAGSLSSEAQAINASGQVVGGAIGPVGLRGFFWSAATGMQDVGSLGGQAQANDINDQGQVVGWSQNGAGQDRAVLWTAAAGMTDLGTLPGKNSGSASAINNGGHVVGTSSVNSSDAHAFFWSPTDGMVDLGAGLCFSTATDINDQDQIVGAFVVGTPLGCSGLRAGLWTPSLALRVAIDIKPGSFPNSINLGSDGNVPVAIFGADGFDVTTVDPLTVTLAGAQVQLRGRGTPMTDLKDVDGDGRLDLVVHISTDALALTATDVQAVLDGTTVGGTRIRGFDTVRIVP